MNAPTPIALFAYNRPERLGRAVAALAACRRFDECRLHVFCDGSRDALDREAVEATRAVVRDLAGRHGAVVVERPTNLGLAHSIVDGVTSLCESDGRVIVVEDDLVVAPGFLDYMLQALDKYADQQAIYQVAGYMYPVKHDLGQEAVFMPLTMPWGWATWARAWAAFDWEAPGAREAMADPVIRRRFDLDGSCSFSRMLMDKLSGRNDSWWALWWWSVFRAGGLGVFPPRSLVWVGGLDGSGRHSARQDGSRINSTRRPPTAKDQVNGIRLPNVVAVNQEALRAVVDFNWIWSRSRSGFARRVARRLRRVVYGAAS